eukprot:1010237-Lingulodinium_polyedra.AAC.1
MDESPGAFANLRTGPATPACATHHEMMQTSLAVNLPLCFRPTTNSKSRSPDVSGVMSSSSDSPMPASVIHNK